MQQTLRRILVVDDSRDAAESFALVLQSMGHYAEFVTDPCVALPAARNMRAELVFVDIGMPTINGYELAGVFRAESGLEHMRIVAVTGYGKDEDRVRSRMAGFDAHVAKPADPAVIESILLTIFDPRATG